MNLSVNWLPFSLESNPTHSPYNPLILIQIQTCHSLKTLQWFSAFRIKMILLSRTKGFLLFVLYLLLQGHLLRFSWHTCPAAVHSALLRTFLGLGLCLLFLQVSFQVPRLFCLSLFSGQMPFCCACLYLSVIKSCWCSVCVSLSITGSPFRSEMVVLSTCVYSSLHMDIACSQLI